MTKRTKIISFVVLILMLTLLFSVFFYFQENEDKEKYVDKHKEEKHKEEKDKEEKDKEEKDKEEKDREEERDEGIYQMAKDYQSATTCLRIEDKTIKNSCIKNIAIENMKRRECEMIKDVEVKEDCVDKINLKEAKEKEDVEMCLNMNSAVYLDRCISSIVKENTDLEDMEEQCEMLTEDKRKVCLDEMNFNLALSEKEISYCGEIEGASIRQECFHTIISSLDLEDESICENSLSEDMEKYCKDVIANYN